MAVLKTSEARKMDTKAQKEKIEELRLELIKTSVHSSKSKIRTKEVKKALARLLTLRNEQRRKGAEKK